MLPEKLGQRQLTDASHFSTNGVDGVITVTLVNHGLRRTQ